MSLSLEMEKKTNKKDKNVGTFPEMVEQKFGF